MRTFSKIGLAAAAAFGIAYGGYLTGKNSNETIQNQPLEENVCEEVNTGSIWEEGRRAGYLEGLRKGVKDGKAAGERETKDKWFEKGRDYGYGLGFEEGNNAGYAAGFEEGNQQGYEGGLIEGEQIGIKGERRRYFNNNSSSYKIFNNGGNHYISWHRETTGGRISSKVYFNRNMDPEMAVVVISGVRIGLHGWVELFDDTNVGDEKGEVDRIRVTTSSTDILYNRYEDFQTNHELFLWADQRMQEETGFFLHPSTHF